MYDLSASVIWTCVCVFVDYRSAVIRFIRAIIEPFSFKENPAMSDCTYRNILILNIVSMIYSSILLSLYILFILLQKCKHWGRRWTCFPLSVIFPLCLSIKIVFYNLKSDFSPLIIPSDECFAQFLSQKASLFLALSLSLFVLGIFPSSSLRKAELTAPMTSTLCAVPQSPAHTDAFGWIPNGCLCQAIWIDVIQYCWWKMPLF